MDNSSFRIRTNKSVELRSFDGTSARSIFRPEHEWVDAQFQVVGGTPWLVIPSLFGGLPVRKWKDRWEFLMIEVERRSGVNWEDFNEEDWETPCVPV